MIRRIERRPWLALLLFAACATLILGVIVEPWLLVLPACALVIHWTLRWSDRFEGHQCCGRTHRGANLVIHQALEHAP